MNILKSYMVCFLLMPFITYCLGYNDYFLQSKVYLPILLNYIFSFILILKQKNNIVIPAFKWFAGIIFLFLFSGFTNGFGNQIFIDKSLLLYVLVFSLFIQYFLNQKLNNHDKIKLAFIFVFFAFLQLLLSFLILYLGMETANGMFFKGNFIGVFYNPAIYVNWMLLLTPFLFMFVGHVNSRIYNYRIIGWLSYFMLIVFSIIILINKNRTGMIVMVAVMVYNLYVNLNINHKKILLISTISCLFLFLVNSNKEDSNNGRILILKVTSNMIGDNPLFGIGFNNYRSEYNNYQKEYFKTSRSDKEMLLANDHTNANNEWLQFIAEIGLVGFFLFLFFLFKIYKILFKTNTVIFGVNALLFHCRNRFLIVVLLLSIFSNPFRIPEILNIIGVLFLFFSIVIPFDKTIEFMNPTFSKKTLLVILFVIFNPFLVQEYYLFQWMKHNKKFFNGNIENFNYTNIFLDKNESYLYTTSNELFYKGNYYGSIKQLENLKNIKNDSQSEILFGLNYSKLEQHDKAIEYFQSANLMNPKLFRPKHLIMNEYLAKGDTISAVKEAKKIISFPVKIPSNEIDYYIAEARLVSYLK